MTNLIASILIGYGRIFRSKKTIEKESQTHYDKNIYEEKHRLIETRIAQVGAVLLAIGFANRYGKCDRRLSTIFLFPIPYFHP
ncbi:MAG: hypothetical protein QN834_07945 [Nitrososphaeraceae archaeon]|nr:hypothetical protein [Nitrososphaeraceae archaeon]MDW0271324.1 hypothetical protein [Nitrososphaeraceae archaeon]